MYFSVIAITAQINKEPEINLQFRNTPRSYILILLSGLSESLPHMAQILSPAWVVKSPG